MKKIAIFIILIAIAIPAYAVEKKITFEWDANQESYLGGYRLWYSINQQGGPYNGPMEDFGKVVTGSTVIDIFPGEVFYFVLTAYADPAQCPTCKESGYSNEVFFSLDPSDPANYPVAAPALRLKSVENASSSR